MVLINILPNFAKGMLPVTTNHFNRAVTSLGRAVISLKDTLMLQIAGLSRKQDELGDAQDRTFDEVINVKGSVESLKDNLSLVQESLDLCHASLSDSERRTSYIARGVQLLTRGVSTFLPEDEALLHELVQFNAAGEEFNTQTPLQQQRLKQAMRLLHEERAKLKNNGRRAIVARSDDEVSSSDPENDVPATCPVEGSVKEVRALLDSVRWR